jgi:hypothetical protein
MTVERYSNGILEADFFDFVRKGPTKPPPLPGFRTH